MKEEEKKDTGRLTMSKFTEEKLEEYKKKLLAEGEEKGLKLGILESAKRLKAKGLPLNKIAELLDLDISEIEKL